MNEHTYHPPIPIPDTDLAIVRYECDGQTLILDTGRGLYVPGLAFPSDRDAALAAAVDRMANPLEPSAPDTTPQVVGSGQIRGAMLIMGMAETAETLETTIAEVLRTSIAEPMEREVALALWHNASEFKRSHPFIEVVRQVFELSTEQIDTLFDIAATL